MGAYIPPYSPLCEEYWQTLLDEGPLSFGDIPGTWEWIEAPAISPVIWEEARELQKMRTVLKLSVDGFNRGGLVAHWKSIECFIPASHLIAYPFPADPIARETQFEEYTSQILRLCIIEVEPSRNRILLSERQVAECDISTPEWPDWLAPGNVCQGQVTSVRPFGAFVDIGPLEGMVHISEISWGRVRHPRDFIEPGEDVDVIILNIDPDHQRVGLSLKRLVPNPWQTVENHIQPGDVVNGKVASVERFGIFVELVHGLEGLLHVSELKNNGYSTELNRDYRVGQDLQVRILEIISEEHRIALGLSEQEGFYAL